MRPLKSLIPLDEAKRICLDSVVPIERTDRVNITQANGRVVAEDVVSKICVPDFDRSAKDGYAVRAEDTFGAGKFNPKTFKIVERVYAGQVPQSQIEPGECVQIATGTMIPQGADAVVMVENTDKDEEGVLVYEPVYPKENVSKRGTDIEDGSKVLEVGEILNPGRIGAATSLGLDSLVVYKRPKVGIISTGDEVVDLGGSLKPGQVYNTNSYTMRAVVEDNGGIADLKGIVKDRLEDVRAKVEECSKYDIILTSAGSSAGERDIILDIMQEVGEILFHGIAVRPGKPTLFGKIGKALFLGMPGFPTSCLSNSYLLLIPMLRKMARLYPKLEKAIEMPLGQGITSDLGKDQFYTVKIVDGVAMPAFKDSGAITSMSQADGYILIPPNVDLIEKNEKVEVKLL